MVEDVFDDARLDAVAGEVTEVIDRLATELVAEGKLSQTYSDRPFESRLSYINAETLRNSTTASPRGGQLSLPSIFELIRTPALLDIAEQLCGPELIASSVYRIRPKVSGIWPSATLCTLASSDSGYFEPFCDNSMVLTCWLPLLDATSEMGCLQSH